MKIIHKNVSKHKDGDVTLICENNEDMWLVYNLIAIENLVEATSIRNVNREGACGNVSGRTVRVKLVLKVEKCEFETQSCVLHVKGRNVRENVHVKMQAYHTHKIQLNEKFRLYKDFWDSVAMEQLEDACDINKIADVSIILMDEGLANMCLLTSNTTNWIARISVNIPKKRKGIISQHEKGLEKFYAQVFQALERNINWELIKCVVIASVGFVKDHFFAYLKRESVKQEKRNLIENMNKFLLTHCSTALCYGISEVLADESCAQRLMNTKATAEIKALHAFMEMMKNDENRAFYGVKHVEKAVEAVAIDTLLICDSLFRSNDIRERRKFVDIVDKVRESQGTVRIFSSQHETGKQLQGMSGVAALLRFPILDSDSDSTTDDDDEDVSEFCKSDEDDNNNYRSLRNNVVVLKN